MPFHGVDTHMWAVSMSFWRWLLVAQLALIAALIVAANRPEPLIAPAPVCIDVISPYREVTATLVTRQRYPDCGYMLVETPLEFTDLAADNATIRVLVPCAEMPRAMYSRDAGDAPVLEVGRVYRLYLTRNADGMWRAERIDLVR
jgi:hypothetical protein